jgi:hypothetical protein
MLPQTKKAAVAHQLGKPSRIEEVVVKPKLPLILPDLSRLQCRKRKQMQEVVGFALDRKEEAILLTARHYEINNIIDEKSGCVERRAVMNMSRYAGG